MKKFIIAALVVGGLTGCQSDSKELDVFYMYSQENGAYFLEPTAEVENVIFVDNASLNAWKIPEDIHHGTKFVGEFDSEGWELQGLHEGGDSE